MMSITTGPGGSSRCTISSRSSSRDGGSGKKRLFRSQYCLAGDLGHSTAVGIGGDPVRGSSFIDLLQLFNADPETRAVVLIGEIGGSGEEEAAAWIRDNMKKPVAGYISGRTAPPGRRMGHAGAIIAGSSGGAEGKIRALEECGAVMARTPDRIGEALVTAAERAPESAGILRG